MGTRFMITIGRITQLTSKPYPTAEDEQTIVGYWQTNVCRKSKLKKLKSTTDKLSVIGPCFRCQHRVDALEGTSRMRCECGDFLQANWSCYAYTPIKPLIMRRNKADRRPYPAPIMFSARAHAVGEADCKLVYKKTRKGIVLYWKPK